MIIAALGEKCDPEGKSVPLPVVEGITIFLEISVSFPTMRNK
jgi:hypothetical protein